MDKVKDLEVENVTVKTWLELLESWLLKVEGNVKKVIEKLINPDIPHKEAKVDALVKELDSLKEGVVSAPRCISKVKSCKKCAETLSRTAELEKNMVSIHGSEKLYACEVCGKSFYLKWRLRKHTGVHHESVSSRIAKVALLLGASTGIVE